MNHNTATSTGALRFTAAVLLATALLHTANAAAAPKKFSAGELLLRIPVPAGLAAQLGGLTGTELLEITAGSGSAGPTARLVNAQQLPLGSACVLTGIAGATPQEMHAAAMAAARETGNALEAGGITGTAEAVQAVLTRLEAAARGELPEDFMRQMGWVLTALQTAFHALLHAPSAAEGLVQVVGCGGDTDTNGAIAGALLGAAYGRQAWPARWTTQVLACRPVQGSGTQHPRPPEYWPDDIPELAEALLGVRAMEAKS